MNNGSNNAQAVLLASYRVNYLSGLPNGGPQDWSSPARKFFLMQMYDTGFLFVKQDFPTLWMPHQRIVCFQLDKGAGTVEHFCAKDYSKEKIIAIGYIDELQQIRFVRFEMMAGTTENYLACQELVSLMRANGIFEKFASIYLPGNG